MPYLQPYHIFIAETTRINELYWTSKYANTRVAALLKVISDTSSSTSDPRVDTLWASTDSGEKSHITRSLSDFTKRLEANSSALRTTSILHMCSAFETALSNYYALCTLYLPGNVISNYKGSGVPEILKTPLEYEKLKAVGIKKAGENLHGAYTKRIRGLVTTFGLSPLSASALVNLDGYYSSRHLIAHDQSLAAADAPDLSVKEVLQSQISIDEPTWKALIKDFHSTLEELDKAIQKQVVTDKAFHLATYHIIARDGTMRLGELKHKLTDEWKFGTFSSDVAENAAKKIGLKIRLVSGHRWVSA